MSNKRRLSRADRERFVPAGAPGPSLLVNVNHHCGHQLRWHFFGATFADVLGKAGIASALLCPLCDGTLREPGDVSYWPSGICHAHDGACPDSPHADWLDVLGCRFRPNALIFLGE